MAGIFYLHIQSNNLELPRNHLCVYFFTISVIPVYMIYAEDIFIMDILVAYVDYGFLASSLFELNC